MQIVKSPNDRRLFKYIKLQNDLQVLLVSDIETQYSSASLSISIGSNNEYFDNEIEGVAHFLEHMLFMGSEKYPDENDYGKYILENNGSSNAFTENNHTNYYFNCVPEGLLKILDVFAQIFISPLFKMESVERELNAVDSEFQNSLTNEYSRFNAVCKQFMKKTHPNSKFNFGCLKTLNVPNIQKIVYDFYNKYYSSHLMKLVVIGKETLDELEKNITTMFSKITKKNVHNNTNYGNVFDAPIYAKIIPIVQEHELTIMWEFNFDNNPDYSDFYDFIAHIIEHEGEGSLADMLYQEFLIKSLCTSMSKHDFGKNVIMNIEINLTNDGFKHIELVKNIIMNYIKMLSVASYNDMCKLFNEFKLELDTEFENYSIPDPESFAIKLTSLWATKHIDPINLVAYYYTFKEYDINIHKIIINILSKMTINNVIIFESSKTFESIENPIEIEKWYNVKYFKCEPYVNQITYQNETLSLPCLNPYVCNPKEHILINANKFSCNIQPQKLPFENMNVWWNPDTVGKSPEIYLMINVLFPNKSQLIKNQIIDKLYFNCFYNITNAKLFNMSKANYGVDIIRHNNGFYIDICGNSSKFKIVLKTVIEELLNFKNKITKSLFNNVKELYKQEISNYIYDSPYTEIDHELLVNIADNFYSDYEILNKLQTITYDDLMQYDLFENNKQNTVGPNMLYGIIQGNITFDETFDICKYLNKFNPIDYKLNFDNPLKELKINEFEKTLENENEKNSCYKLAIKIGYLYYDLDVNYIEKITYLEVLDSIISDKYFDQLRTKEQLGYIVQSNINTYGNNEHQLYTTYDYCIQSSIKDGIFLKNRTIKFVKEFKSSLENESSTVINNIINSQILQLGKSFQNLQASANYNYEVINSHCNNFNITNDKILCLKTMTKEKLIDFYNKYFSLANNTFWSMILNSKESKLNKN